MVNRWDVLAGGLQKVQSETVGRGVRMDGKAKRLGKAVDRASRACGSAKVSRALSGFKGYVTGEHRAAGSRIVGSITGLGTAGRAFTDADDQMAGHGNSALGHITDGLPIPEGSDTGPPAGHPAGPVPEDVFRIPNPGTSGGGG